MRRDPILLILLLGAAILGPRPVLAQDLMDEEPLQTQVVISQSAVRPGDALQLALIIDITQGFHLYGEGATPGLTQVAVRAKDHPDLEIGPFELPAPTRKKDPFGDMQSLYEGRIVATAPVTASKALADESVKVELELDYQACTDEACLPAERGVLLAGTLPVQGADEEVEPRNMKIFGSAAAEEGDGAKKPDLAAGEAEPARVKGRVLISQSGVRPGDEFWAAAVLEIEAGWHLYGEGVEGGLPMSVEMAESEFFEFGEVVAPRPVVKLEPYSGLEQPIYEGEIRFLVKAKAAAELPRAEVLVEFDVNYQACSDEMCELPVDLSVEGSFPVLAAGADVTPAHVDIFEGADAAGAAGPDDGADTGKFEEILREKGFILALLGSFLFGLAAAASPCVYPMVPITVSYFTSQAGKTVRPAVLAIFYVLGICATYTILGLVVASIGGSMGAVLQKPAVLITFALFFVAMALSMFGLFEMRLPSSWSAKLQSGNRQGVGGALFMGSILGLIAAPCVAPFLASLLAYVAKTQDRLIGGTSLFSFGLGMGVPFLFLGIISGSAAGLPRAGAWMEHVKSFFGFVMIGVAIYFLGLVPWISPVAISVAWALLFIVGGVWLGAFRRSEKDDGWAQILTKSGGIVAVLLGGYLLLATVAANGLIGPRLSFGVGGGAVGGGAVAEDDHGIWVDADTVEDFDAALAVAKASESPVVVDFWAVWCTPCRILERDVLLQPDVQAYLEERGFTTLRVDVTDDASDVAKMKIDRYGSRAMPQLIFFDSKGNRVKGVASDAGGKVSKETFLEIAREVR